MTDFEYESSSPYNPRSLHVQNRRARAVVGFAMATARRYEAHEAEPAEVDRVNEWYEAQFFDGMGVDLAELFPSAASRRFWCRALFDAAHHVLHNTLADPQARFLHAGCICDLITIARMLRVAALDLDRKWSGPLPIDWREEEEYNAKRSGGAD